MRLFGKFGAVLATVVIAFTTVGIGTAQAAHYQGGDYGLCVYPRNAAYDGVWVEAYGLGSDSPRNYLAAARAKVIAAQKCVRSHSAYHVSRVQIDKVALRYNNVNYGTVGPVNHRNRSLTVDSKGVHLPACGKYAQAAVRYTVRYTDGSLLGGYLNSAGFRRC